MSDFTIQQWLSALVPLDQLVKIVAMVMPAFITIAIMLLIIGYHMALLRSEEMIAPTGGLIILCFAVSASPWLLSLCGSIVYALVTAITSAVPSLSWIVVANPSDTSLAFDFTRPFSIIAQYVAGKLSSEPTISGSSIGFWELNKWADYLTRSVFILLTGIVACVTVFIMEAMLLVQKVIMIFSRLLVPIWIAALAIPAARGSAQNFLKFVLGVMCWPIGWAIVHIGTLAALEHLTPPSLNASLGELILAFGTLLVVCLWPIVGTIGAPILIARMVTSGTNFAQHLASNFVSVGGQHAVRHVTSASSIAGAVVGGALGGPAGALTGAKVGARSAEILSLPLASATQSAEGLPEGKQPVPTSRSAEIADRAIGIIKARS
jgi:hypothetical protein